MSRDRNPADYYTVRSAQQFADRHPGKNLFELEALDEAEDVYWLYNPAIPVYTLPERDRGGRKEAWALAGVLGVSVIITIAVCGAIYAALTGHLSIFY